MKYEIKEKRDGKITEYSGDATLRELLQKQYRYIDEKFNIVIIDYKDRNKAIYDLMGPANTATFAIQY